MGSSTSTLSIRSINFGRLVKSRQYRYNSSGDRSTVILFLSFTPEYREARMAIAPAIAPKAAVPASTRTRLDLPLIAEPLSCAFALLLIYFYIVIDTDAVNVNKLAAQP